MLHNISCAQHRWCNFSRSFLSFLSVILFSIIFSDSSHGQWKFYEKILFWWFNIHSHFGSDFKRRKTWCEVQGHRKENFTLFKLFIKNLWNLIKNYSVSLETHGRVELSLLKCDCRHPEQKAQTDFQCPWSRNQFLSHEHFHFSLTRIYQFQVSTSEIYLFYFGSAEKYEREINMK